MSTSRYRFSYRGRAPSRRFGMPSYRGGIVKRRTYRRGMQSRRYGQMRAVAMRPGGWISGPGARGELKAIDVSLTGTAMNSTPLFTLLNGCARGDDIGERTGRQITPTKLSIRGYSQVTSGTGIDQCHRFIVFIDHQPNGAAPTVTDLLTASSVVANTNLDNRNRFTIVMDRMFQLNASAESGSKRNINVTIPLKMATTFNSGNAGTIADIQTNSLYLLTFSDVAAGATAGFVELRLRTRFYDK